jgi:DNA-binding transcriptional ArsR family regulator
MADKFIMMGLDDERSKEIAEILGNSTSKKIIAYLAEVKDASEKDISDKLVIPINTVEYNLNKLMKAGLIEKTKHFFWSVKGKKIDMYRLSDRKIIISPKTFVKGIVPSVLAVIFGAFGIKLFMDRMNVNEMNVVQTSLAKDSFSVAKTSAESGMGVSPSISNSIVNSCSNLGSETWLWFLLGGLFAILIFIIWNHFYLKMKGGI